MLYYFSKSLSGGFAEVRQRTVDALKQEGFGIITEIDVQSTMKEKLGRDFRRYSILGACNPALAFEALAVEDKVGLMLPCNVIVQEKDGAVEVAVIDPVASMLAIDNPRLKASAEIVQAKLKNVVAAL